MKMYTTLMSAYGVSAGINYKFGGTVANTMDAHRVIQHFQEEKGPETADKIIDCMPPQCLPFIPGITRGHAKLLTQCQALYSQYFENEKHPAADETLLKALDDAGVAEDEAKAFVEDRSEGMMDVKMAVREQASLGIDSVPHIVIEGKRRDLTLVGAKEVEEYEKALAQIVKESK